MRAQGETRKGGHVAHSHRLLDRKKKKHASRWLKRKPLAHILFRHPCALVSKRSFDHQNTTMVFVLALFGSSALQKSDFALADESGLHCGVYLYFDRISLNLYLYLYLSPVCISTCHFPSGRP
jgi:hypothetical protein